MSLSFAKVAYLWKEDKRQYVKKSSFAIYLQLLTKHIMPHFAYLPVIDEAAIQQFANSKLKSGYNLKTVKDILLVLKMILNYGTKIGAWPHIQYKIHFPTRAERANKLTVIPLSDQKKIISHLRDNFSFRNLGILICLNTGLRIGEICALQWKDIDTASGVIHVNKTIQRIYLVDGSVREYHLSVDTPKTPSSVRDIPIAKDLMTYLKPFKKMMQGDHYLISGSSEPVEPRYYRDYYNRLLRSLEIPNVRFHALRHSFATRCIESKCDYKTVSVILGHSSISTTMDLYVHPGLDEKKKVIEKMAKNLW